MGRLLSVFSGKRLFLSFFLFLSSCSTALKDQSQVSRLCLQDNYVKAKAILNDNSHLYGRKNTLLYFLDKGLILHLSGDYKESIAAFDKAKRTFDELYTRSLSAMAGTWLVNEYSASYHGEDFERVMINIFQALNYLMVGDLDEALVEARQVDSKLSVINSRYKPGEKNAYKEDAFARLFMGIIYEASNTPEDMNNAFISYRKALETYETDYRKNYDFSAPSLLKENLLATADYMGIEEAREYRKKYHGIPFLSLKEKSQKAQVYLIQYEGVSPTKEEGSLVIPLPDGYLVKMAFPKYRRIPSKIKSSFFSARDSSNGVIKAQVETGEDISALAMQNLESRKVRVMAKAIAVSSAKYLVERQQEEAIRKKFGAKAADSFKIASSVFNAFSTKADTRSWQTLPSEIRIARLCLNAGEYSFFVENTDSEGGFLESVTLGKIKVAPGETKFFLIRSL